MHLLDTTTKQLKTFYGKNIPKYAILSHMWGAEEDEVLFRHIIGSDVDRNEGKIRKGYAKIEGVCKQAVEDGWKYIWIDTCCIDKGSSAELSEAINSMYGWYRNSEVCYVYLEDVLSSGDVQSGKNATFPIVSFERSRWFSRGWTLQELIAPQHVVFLSKDWVDIGTKASLRDTISVLTRIRVEMLTAYDPEKASVAEKMSWAAFRETTRAEDSAYCLMGLLGVNMPLLYGEGDRAFRRLQEEIMKVSDDDSLFAWKARRNIQNHPDNTRGMLAASPLEFRDGMDIVRSNDGAYSPYSMTNQGLQIKLPLLPIDPIRDPIGINSENIFKATLKCTIRQKGPTQWIVIYLKMIREGHYQRIFPHWLDETKTNPNKTGTNELTSLLVPQVGTLMAHNRPEIRDIDVEILPTESGFTIEGCSLTKGHKAPFIIKYASHLHAAIYFKRQEKYFGVIIGSDNGVPWLDFIDFMDKKWSFYYSYKEGGSRVHAKARHLDQLSEKIPGEDWWVTVSVRKAGHTWAGFCFRAIIDIQKATMRIQGSYIPSAISASNRFSGDFPGNLDSHSIHPGFKKEGSDWFATFNPRVKRMFNISLVYSFMHESVVNCIQFSRDGKYLATGSSEVRIYDVETGIETYTFNGEQVSITSICFSSDSRFLATGDTSGRVELWDVGAKRTHKSFKGHQKAINSLCFSLDGRLIISGSKDGSIRIWEVADGTSRILNYDHGISVSISPNGRLVAASSSRGIIRIWDVVTTRLLEELEKHGDHVHVAFTPDGKGLVTGSTEKTLKYWDVSELVPTGVERGVEHPSDSGAPSMLAGTDLGKISRHTMTFTGHTDSVDSVAVSHDGRWVISGSNGGVLFWDLENATAQFVLEMGSVRSVYTSPVGNMFATAGKGVRIWRYDNI